MSTDGEVVQVIHTTLRTLYTNHFNSTSNLNKPVTGEPSIALTDRMSGLIILIDMMIE